MSKFTDADLTEMLELGRFVVVADRTVPGKTEETTYCVGPNRWWYPGQRQLHTYKGEREMVWNLPGTPWADGTSDVSTCGHRGHLSIRPATEAEVAAWRAQERGWRTPLAPGL